MAQRIREEEIREGDVNELKAERDSVGVLLARARRDLGQEVADVAANLRIRRVYLQAIEDGRYAELPGTTYAVGFVRSYAEYLHLDSEFLVERFKSEIAGLEGKPSLHFPAPKPEGRVPGGALVVISVLLIALTYGGWYYANQNNLLDDLLRQETDSLTAAVPDAPEDEADTAAPAVDGSADTATPAANAGAESPAADEAEAEDQPTVRTPRPPLGGTLGSSPQPDSRPEAGRADVPPAETATLLPPPEPAADASPEPTTGTSAEPAAETAPEQALQAPGVQAGSVEPEVAAQSAAAEPVAAEDLSESDLSAAEATDAAEVETGIATAATETMEADIPAAPDLPTEVSEGSGRVYGVANGESRVVVTATSDSWVQVRSADDNLLITRVLRAGDVYRVPDQQGLTLETGNAGGLTITVDGRTAPALGRSGDVLRGVSLEPQALLSGRAAP
ncbi:helix-turn-helix domain-containing protein [Algihabitans albus]|uniref:helix-turn-helix domain-containing protein n=1 Tax=Algihabitans albus TaxID=2164067 RepID=UPI0013C2AD93|nr:helix-turn-helix domain-containing protein [Algihabitans albus]